MIINIDNKRHFLFFFLLVIEWPSFVSNELPKYKKKIRREDDKEKLIIT